MYFITKPEVQGGRRLEMLRFLYSQLKGVCYGMKQDQAGVQRQYLGRCRIPVLAGRCAAAQLAGLHLEAAKTQARALVSSV